MEKYCPKFPNSRRPNDPSKPRLIAAASVNLQSTSSALSSPALPLTRQGLITGRPPDTAMWATATWLSPHGQSTRRRFTAAWGGIARYRRRSLGLHMPATAATSIQKVTLLEKNTLRHSCDTSLSTTTDKMNTDTAAPSLPRRANKWWSYATILQNAILSVHSHLLDPETRQSILPPRAPIKDKVEEEIH